ncbi:exodeoxyribonuclease V, gamma subunit [Burkholderiales bacterium JOSHI_001]|nr:exodeoxyribonuclease V, gamma subunit [Burkholderiales bacterium JOSHI_001]
MVDDKPTGLLVLHGNRLELLAEAVFSWLAANPLAPLEQETFLVQSNGMAEWLKMELASALGVCAATSVELPARFVWRAYRAVLGRGAVPVTSPLDKLPLTWRLMKGLPTLAAQPGFAPVAGFLGPGDAARRLQLAQRLADQFDQYQVYRSDWLADWGQGQDVLRPGAQAGGGHGLPVPADQGWQPALWRALQAGLTPAEQGASRAALHQRFLHALQAPAPRQGKAFADLPRRVVLFGTTHMPHQTLQAIAALAAHCQVLMAVPNPCRYHWADIIDGRELMRIERRRHALRGDRDLSAVPLQDMHAHGHPLLAAWGPQCRDFVRQLDAFDDAQAARQRFQLPRVDLFDNAPGQTLLQQVQAAVRDLLPLAEHAKQAVPATDRSIVFHVAHSAQREVEILHDQLLELLARPPAGQALAPRDIVVMVPDIDRFAPAIRSVFGQHPRWDPRHIPWGIADQKLRGQQPLLVALDMLLRAPHQRFGASQVRDLLDVPAIAARFGMAPEDLTQLVPWIEGAGVRWGLNAAQRDSLGLGAGGDQNTWAFGLRRMLLGYATGELAAAEGYGGIEPYTEVAGLAAGLAGALADLLRVLTEWWTDTQAMRTPGAWADRLRRLTADLFQPGDDNERAQLAALGDALSDWLQACDAAGFDDTLDLAVVREAWLGTVDQPQVSRRFKAGGVTFCTLLPMRAIPFEVVCLLGMNDGDYPRRGSRIDFDLMALPGQARPGDRSRRDDDRQLMLDALLSARQVLYISWAGRSQRDNQVQPPSVLVSQLRDYLDAGWRPGVAAQRTTEHPLQPFSRRYFEPAAAGDPAPLFTHATEWRAAHAETEVPAPEAATAPRDAEDSASAITVQGLTAFLRNPVKAFFRHRLQVSFDDLEGSGEDDETFAGQGLERWDWVNEVLQACQRAFGMPDAASTTPDGVEAVVQQQVARLQRAGRLPMAGPGRVAQTALRHSLLPMVAAWCAARSQHAQARDKLPLRLVHPQDEGLVFDDWLVGLRAAGPGAVPVWIELQASKLADAGGKNSGPVLRQHTLLAAWVRCLASAACGLPSAGIVIGEGAWVRVTPPEPEEALPLLLDLMRAWREGVQGDAPLPTAARTGLAWLTEPGNAHQAYDGRYNSRGPGEGKEACLARLFPSFASLAAQPQFDATSRRLYGPYRQWLTDHASLQLLGPEPVLQGTDDD